MSDAYDVQYFEPDYCQGDVSRIVAAIKGKASVLVVGMPGCGKSRLINFLLQRSDVQERYGLSNNLKFIRVDGDIVDTRPQGMYIEFLSAVVGGVQSFGDGGLDVLKNKLIAEVRTLDKNLDLVVVFDNFVQSLQQALGESFFNFLFALRNIRPKLNVVYIFVANLKIDFDGFYKVDRLFDMGANRSVCWVSPLNWKDTVFSINRQLHKAEHGPDSLNEADKERIYSLAGGHARLTRHLTHLMAAGEVGLNTEPEQLLEYGSIRAACEAIWNDLDQNYKNYLIDLAAGRIPTRDASPPIKILQSYGVLKDRASFFSLLFENFVKAQEKTRAVVDVRCDETQIRLIIRSLDSKLPFAIHGLSRRKRRLFCYLIENQGETCSKAQLIKAGWPSDFEQGVSDGALSRQIDGIRSWLKQVPQLSQYIAIETIWGEGYQLAIRD